MSKTILNTLLFSRECIRKLTDVKIIAGNLRVLCFSFGFAFLNSIQMYSEPVQT